VYVDGFRHCLYNTFCFFNIFWSSGCLDNGEYLRGDTDQAIRPQMVLSGFWFGFLRGLAPSST
jgi:hypothetical protein